MADTSDRRCSSRAKPTKSSRPIPIGSRADVEMDEWLVDHILDAQPWMYNNTQRRRVWTHLANGMREKQFHITTVHGLKLHFRLLYRAVMDPLNVQCKIPGCLKNKNRMCLDLMSGNQATPEEETQVEPTVVEVPGAEEHGFEQTTERTEDRRLELMSRERMALIQSQALVYGRISQTSDEDHESIQDRSA